MGRKRFLKKLVVFFRKKTTNTAIGIGAEEEATISSNHVIGSEESCDSSNINNSTKNGKEKEKDCCCICMNVPKPTKAASINGCQHSFCYKCIDEWSRYKNTCPLCLAPFKKIKLISSQRTKRVRDTTLMQAETPRDTFFIHQPLVGTLVDDITERRGHEEFLERRLELMTIHPYDDGNEVLDDLYGTHHQNQPGVMEPIAEEIYYPNDDNNLDGSFSYTAPSYRVATNTYSNNEQNEYQIHHQNQFHGRQDSDEDQFPVAAAAASNNTNYHEFQQENDEDIAMAKAISMSEALMNSFNNQEPCLHLQVTELDDMIEQREDYGQDSIEDNGIVVADDDDIEGKMPPSLAEVATSTTEQLSESIPFPRILEDNKKVVSDDTSNNIVDERCILKEMFLYMNRVKHTFEGKPHDIYNKFLTIMEQYENAEERDIPRIIECIIILFYGHNDLILDFNILLPKGYDKKITIEDIKTIVEQQKTGSTMVNDGEATTMDTLQDEADDYPVFQKEMKTDHRIIANKY